MLTAVKMDTVQWLLVVLLYANVVVLVSSTASVVREHSCDFEVAGSLCGWVSPAPPRGGMSGVASAADPPALGPHTDTNPGTPDGHYFYFNTSSLAQKTPVLRFPSHQYVCQLAFAYYIVGAFDLEILRENLPDMQSVPLNESYTSSNGVWETASISYNVTTSPEDFGAIAIEIEEIDGGESELWGELFLGLDSVNLTFCLPCDFDGLSVPGNLNIMAPSNLSVALRAIQSHTFTAFSLTCPNETLVFGIESVQPDHLSTIFTLNSTTGQLVVNGRGPGLDANDTMGTITVSVHVVGSNYTHTGEPFKRTAVIPYHQPPTIVAIAPSNISVKTNISFSFQISSTSHLDVQLHYDHLVTTPPELANDITFEVSSSGRVATISGVVSLSTLSQILHVDVPTVSIRVTDTYGGYIVHTTELLIQDQAPIFNQSQYIFNIPENDQVVIIGAFTVIDPNSDPLDTPEFDPPISNFAVLKTSPGLCTMCEYQIFTTMPGFNYEEQMQYNWPIVVRDTANRSLSSSAIVTVNVLPENEFAPQFTQLNFTASLSDVANVGSYVAEPNAIDGDIGSDGDISYAIISGNDDRFFNISPTFGTVLVQYSPLLAKTYTLTITATDHGNPPLSSRQNAVVVVMVISSTQVDCSDPGYGPPLITSQGASLQEAVGSDVTLQCAYSANPAVRINKWRFYHFDSGTSTYIFSDDALGHYHIERYSLTVYNITGEDGGLYTCNVTNQCGSDTLHYHIEVIDIPEAPTDVEITDGPYERNFTLSWVESSDNGGELSVSRPVDRYTVQVRGVGQVESYMDAVYVANNVTSAFVDGLDPGREYEVRVVASNEAGGTPSNVIFINTTATVPHLQYLRVRALQNFSLMIEWELEYDGGFPISNFLITVTVQLPRQRRDIPDFLHFEVGVSAGRLVTRALERGRIYTIDTTVTNQLGSSHHSTNAYVGQTDSVQCDFEPPGSCPWQLVEGTVMTAGQLGSPSVDAAGKQQGHYISAQLDPSHAQPQVVATYSEAAYVCGYSFSYQLHGSGELVLQSSSGNVIWSSGADKRQWLQVNMSSVDPQFLTHLSDGLQFSLVSQTSNYVLRAFLDDITLDICIPCDFELLQRTENFYLSYENSTSIYLRFSQTLSIEAIVRECPNVFLNFTIARVVPSELQSSFTITNHNATAAAIVVSPIPSDVAAPNTVGFLEVLVSVAYLDYRQEGREISRAAQIEFELLQTNENCSFTETCNFEAGPCRWELGSGGRVSDSALTSLTGTTGSYLYGTYPSSATDPVVIATTTITDNHCAISFAYVTSLVEVQVTIEGLGSIWTSLSRTTEGVDTLRWEREAVQIDFQGEQFLNNWTVAFEVDMMEEFGEAGVDGGGYFALDNITLHPCIDCNTPEFSLSSCFPGTYFSLAEEGCVSCPPGYFCSDWRQLPRPCPPGTYSNMSKRITQSNCQPCPMHTYTVLPASTSCRTCPVGYNCSNPASIPVTVGNTSTMGNASTNCTNVVCPAGFMCGRDGSQQLCPQGEYSFEGQQTCQMCPEGFSCPDPSTGPVPTSCAQTVPLVPVVLGVVGGVIVLLILATCCCVFCYFRRKRAKEKQWRQERQRMLLTGDRDSVDGSTLGRRSMASTSTFDSMGRRRWRKGTDTSTLMSFMTDHSTTNPCFDETPWVDTEELTKPNEEGGVSFQKTGFEEGEGEGIITFHNTGFEDEDSEGEETELEEVRWQRAPRHPTPKSSQF